MDGSPLHREVLAPSIEVLHRIQVISMNSWSAHATHSLLTLCATQVADQLNESEQYAIGHLCSWLQEVDEADAVDDADLDESARLYLKSYRESYSRRKPYPVSLASRVKASQQKAT